MKWQKPVTVLMILLVSLALTHGSVTNLTQTRAVPVVWAADSATLPMIDDFEDGGADIILFSDALDGAAGATTAVATSIINTDSPVIPAVATTNALSFSYDLVINDWGYAYGGFQHEFAITQDWSQYDGFSFWFYGENSGNIVQVELWDNGAGPTSSERFDTNFVDDFSGWKLFQLPFAGFTRATDYQPGGAPDDGLTLTEMWGYNFGIVTAPSSGTFLVDDVMLYVDPMVVDDFEDGGAEITLFSDALDGAQGAQTVVAAEIVTTGSPVIPAVATTNALSFTYDLVINDWGYAYGGFQHEFATTQDWSQHDGFSFWFYGENSGNTIQVELWDNGAGPTSSERFDTNFVDDFSGWKLFRLPFAEFSRATDYQPGGAPDDGLTLTEMWGYNFGIVTVPSTGHFLVDDVVAYRDSGEVVRTVQFAQSAFAVEEGAQAVLTVTLSEAYTDTVTVDYSSADGTAGSADYVAVDDTLNFAPGETTATIAVNTLDNDELDGDKAFTVALANPTNAELGGRASTTVTILDEETPDPNTMVVIDDFESGVAPGEPCPAGGLPLNFCTFNGAGSSIALSNPTTPPAPELPPVGTPNSVLQMNVDVTSFAGFIHGFTNDAGDAWIPQNWSTREGISFWMHGSNSGTAMFIDILDNRNPGSTSDDAERWTVAFTDDFTGWQLLEFPFTAFTRKDVGNGAPNDGLGLFEVHGYAIGTLGTGGPQTYYFDNVSLYGVAEPPALAVSFAMNDTPIEEGMTGDVMVRLNRPFGPEDPAQISVDFATGISNAIPGEEYTPTSGTLTFVNDGPTELTFPLETFDDTKFEGDERIVLRLSNPVDVELGSFQATAVIEDNDPFDPNLLDDFERGAFLWEGIGPVAFDAQRVAVGDAEERPGQDDVENILMADVPVNVDIVVEGRICNDGNGVIPVQLLSTDGFDATTVDHTTVTLADASEAHLDKKSGEAIRHVEDVNGDGLEDLVFHFRFSETGLPCDPPEIPFNGETFAGQAITAGGSDAALLHDFALGQDWTGTETLDFWYYGAGGGEEVMVTLKDNRAPDPGPSGWSLVWSDEFDGPSGAPPNPENWTHEIGDGALNGIPGWGNSELQYYTDDPANAATDGNGNLVITLREADGSLQCYYGPCDYTSARLLSWHKAEFAYGRIESRLRVPDGGDGLWPAFWSLGTDINRTPWPAAGEIDFMEYVSRLPNEIFGTIHGPGYSGGASFGGIYDFGEAVYNDYHTFTIEWEPNLITWSVDGIQYHQAEPADVAGPWVFEKPFFLLLNFAIGGNFGGSVDPDNIYPQEYLVDYVRVYQGPDTAERFEATFVDDFSGWQEVSIPMTAFTRSANQPAGAPDDGLNLDEVWGYGFALPEGNATGEVMVDFVRRVPFPPPAELVVTTLDESGEGSLREALALIADGGTITFDPALAGGTITLASGQLVADRSVTIEGAGITVSGNNASRVLQIAAGATVSISDMTITEGAGAPQGGGILNFGTLNLDFVTVTNNTETSAGPPSFELGGGGIYNGDGATLNLSNSTVSDNSTVAQPGGGIYGFFNSTINVTNSTVSGNVSLDVAGGLRTLGDATIVNSTISGNTSTAWHGGAMFSTDGVVTILNSTIVGNNAPAGTTGGLMVATFGAPVEVTLQNSIVANNGDYSCQIEGDPAVAVLTSLGNNAFTDGSCVPVASDQVVGDTGVDVLADNGGPTLTHALLVGSPAIDAANNAVCPATDQRGVLRDAACDIGAYEYVQ